MEGTEFNREMFNLMKTVIDSTAGMLSMIQEQNEKILNLIVKNSLAAQKEGKKMLDEWMRKAKNSNQIYKTLLQENLRRIFQANAGK